MDRVEEPYILEILPNPNIPLLAGIWLIQELHDHYTNQIPQIQYNLIGINICKQTKNSGDKPGVRLLWEFDLGAFFPGVEVFHLGLGQFVNLDLHGLQFEARNLTVNFFGHRVDGVRQFIGVLNHIFGSQGLVGE